MIVATSAAPGEMSPTRIDDHTRKRRVVGMSGNVVSPTIRPRMFTDVAGKPYGDLLGEGVWDRGKSEWPLVIDGIGVQALPQRENAQTSTWCNRR